MWEDCLQLKSIAMSVLERVQFQELHRRDLMLQEGLKKVSNINSIFVTSISSCAFYVCITLYHYGFQGYALTKLFSSTNVRYL